MSKRRVILNLILVMSIVLVIGSCTYAVSGVDVNRWTSEHIQLSNFGLTFRVPSGESDPLPTLRRVDLNRDVSSDRALVVFNRRWDIDPGFFKGVMGSLRITISAWRRPNHFPGDFTSFENLQTYIARELEDSFTPTNEKLQREGNLQFVVKLPEIYNRVNLNGREWLGYSLAGALERRLYATPLTSNHYLLVAINLVDNTRGHESDWRQQVEEIIGKFLASIEIH
jgi:hypothetical protein